MQFPHLSDTQFPDIRTVNVYQYRNSFDYTRWSEKTILHLCNVRWRSDYADVVKWDTDEDRDSFFDSLDNHVVRLETAARVLPEGYVKLPLPYDVMAQYNYLFIDMPIATSPEQQIDYENPDGIRRWYFFIDSIRYLSPNATQVYVLPDVWTNFQNDVEITYMMLERGHAPVAYSDTSAYLANPIANNRYLLAPDINFDNAGITRSSTYVPFGNGTKYVCFASTCSTDLVSNLGTVIANSDYSPNDNITYSDTSARYGYQLQVNGFSVGNGRDYSAARTPAKAGYSDGRIANNLTVYAIAATEVYGSGATFYADIVRSCPQFLTTLKACFVVDERCITLGGEYTIAGHTVYKCVGKYNTLLQKALTIPEFGYPTELQRFAKLYTAPYAQLEITDNDGNTYEVNIEETTTLTVRSVVSIAFPYINERVYIAGIGGTGSSAYTWKDLRGNTDDMTITNSDWFKYCFDWKIPTFALYMDGETAFQLESFNRNVKQTIQQSLVAYHNTVRSANTAYENACDQADVAYTNTSNSASTARTNAYNSADTGRTNAYNSADTMKTNADYLADIAYNNVDRTCTTATANVTLSNTGTAYNEEQGITVSNTIEYYNETLNSDNMIYGNRLIQVQASEENERSTSASMGSVIDSIASGALSGATTGAMFGAGGGSLVLPVVGTVAGAGAMAGLGSFVGAVGGGIHAAVIRTQVGLTTNARNSIVTAQAEGNQNLTAVGNDFAGRIQLEQNSLRRTVYRENATISSSIQDNSNSTSRANASANRTGAKTVASNNRDTQKTNADNTRTTSRTNANNTYTVDVANADRTRDNIQELAGYTRQVEILNAKEILENGRYAGMAAVLDARNAAPKECCPYSGNPAPDYHRTRGIQIKVKTQSDSAIRQTGDTFARYGYALNQVWDVAHTGLNLMNHFTYWKASEIWVNDGGATNNAIANFVRDMFVNGVTVWNDPWEIGAVDVYSN